MRIKRIKNEGEGYYHLVGRCCEQLFLFKEGEKEDDAEGGVLLRDGGAVVLRD